MGDGEFSGNGSVHWQITHDDDAGNAKPLNAKQGQANHPTTADDINVASRARGRDGVAVANVGKRKGHRGKFRVRLRFENIQDAKNASAAAQDVMLESGMYVLVLDVPVIDRAVAGEPPPAEVKVDW
jgi:hypothetical protein